MDAARGDAEPKPRFTHEQYQEWLHNIEAVLAPVRSATPYALDEAIIEALTIAGPTGLKRSELETVLDMSVDAVYASLHRLHAAGKLAVGRAWRLRMDDIWRYDRVYVLAMADRLLETAS